LFDIETAVFP